MKRMILSAVGSILLGATTAMASNELVLHMTSGTTQRYVLLNEEPTISFSGDNIIVKTSTTESVYAMSEVSYFNYEYNEHSVATEIRGIGTDKDGDGMQVSDDHIAFSGLPAGCKIFIYGTGGQIFKTATADADGKANVSLTSLPQGVYIVNANKISTKITKK